MAPAKSRFAGWQNRHSQFKSRPREFVSYAFLVNNLREPNDKTLGHYWETLVIGSNGWSGWSRVRCFASRGHRFDPGHVHQNFTPLLLAIYAATSASDFDDFFWSIWSNYDVWKVEAIAD
jgi:hypothetical protein